MKKFLSVILCVAVMLTSINLSVFATTDYTDTFENAINNLRWWINSQVAEGENFPTATVIDYTLARFNPNDYGEDYEEFGDGYGYYQTIVIPKETFEEMAHNSFANFSVEELRTYTREQYDFETESWVDKPFYNEERNAYVFPNGGGFGDSGRYVVETYEKEGDKYIVYSNFIEPFSKEFLPDDFVLNEDYFIFEGSEDYFEYCYTIKNVVYISNGIVKFASWQDSPRKINSCHKYDSECDATCNICGVEREITHNYEWVIDKQNDCGNDGKKHEECTVCHAKQNENTIIKATGKHDYKPATCKAPATCKVCGATSGKKNNHKSDNGTITKKATCTATGTKVYKCTSCKVTLKTETLSKIAHKWNSGKVTKAATCKATGVKTYTCSVCRGTKTETIAKSKNHTLGAIVITKATLTKDGYFQSKCKVCNVQYGNKTYIKRPTTFKLSATTYTYDGKIKTPSVVVKDSAGKTLKKGTDYSVKYSAGRKNVGTYTATITFEGKYSGTKKLTFKINPPKTTAKLTAGKSALTVKVNKKNAQVSGYQIQYSTSKSFKSSKTVTLSKNTKVSTTIKKLKTKTTYYVRVRTYKTVGKTKYYSAWSTVTSRKTK